MRNYSVIVGLVLLVASCGSPDKKGNQQETAVCISDSLRKAASVYLTSDEKNNPVMCWCETDNTGKKYFYLSYFDIVATKFSPAINIPIEQYASIHEEGMPKIAVKGDGSIVAVYETSSPTKENEWAGYIRYAQSFDKGKSWSQPRSVHADSTEGKSRSFASITRLGNGEIAACWLDATFDYKKSGRPVKFASTQGNDGFKNEILIDSIACECCRTAISSDDKGNISIVYRDIINDSIRDMSVSSSANNGQSFSHPLSFSGDNWIINGCPHNGPSIVNAGNTTYAAWFTGGRKKGVYYCELNNNKKAINKQLISDQGRFIQLCLLTNGSPVLAYNENIHDGDNIYSKIVLVKIEDGKIFGSDINTGKTMASYPVLRSDC